MLGRVYVFETDTNYIYGSPQNYITNPINVTSSTPANNEMYTHDTSTNVKIDVFDIAAIRSEVSSRIIYVYTIYGRLCYIYYIIYMYTSCRLDSITLKSYGEGVDKITLRRNGFGTSTRMH